MKNDNIDKIPLDAKLLSYAIIELNISRRNVAIYPRDHPSVESSLSNAFKFLKQLFEIRPNITLAVAKDTIIIDKYHLDKKNPVFRDFALNLSRMHVACITLKNGITKDELYRFHRFITEKADEASVDNLKQLLKKYNLPHMDISFVDYRKFATGQLGSAQQTQKVPIWERYIYGLLEGTLHSEEVAAQVREIPPEMLAELLNRGADKTRREDAYDKVITTYMRSSSSGLFSGKDLKRLLEFIDNLKPELKNRFLSSAVKTFSENTSKTYQSLKNISVDEIERFLDTVNKQKISVPPVLRSLVGKFSYDAADDPDTIYLEEELIEDEELRPSELAGLFSNEKPESKVQAPVSENSLQVIQKILDFNAADLKISKLLDFDNEFNEDLIEKRFNRIILELMSSETPLEAEYKLFADIIKGQSLQLLWIGQFGQVLDILKVLEINKARHIFSAISSKTLQYFHSPEFMFQLIESLKLLGRQNKKDIGVICDYYNREIIPYLMDALIEEESTIIRRFLMDLLKQFGNRVVPEAVKRLNDSRWFVKRNMLYILSDLEIKEVSEYIRPYCQDEHPKVSITALKCLLNVKDSYAIEIVRKYLTSGSEELFQQALTLSGSFKIKEIVGDLIHLLNKQEVTGSDILNKIPVIKVLGDIADPRALETLRSLLSMKSIFLRKITDQLKEEIYKTLGNYPYELIKDMVEEGMKSRNEIIKKQSLLLYKEYAK